MEGRETGEFDPLTLPVPGIQGAGWRLILKTPSIDEAYVGGPIVLDDSAGLVYERAA